MALISLYFCKQYLKKKKIAFNFSRLVLHRYWVHYINFIFLKFYQTLHRAVSEAFFLNFTH